MRKYTLDGKVTKTYPVPSDEYPSFGEIPLSS